MIKASPKNSGTFHSDLDGEISNEVAEHECCTVHQNNETFHGPAQKMTDPSLQTLNDSGNPGKYNRAVLPKESKILSSLAFSRVPLEIISESKGIDHNPLNIKNNDRFDMAQLKATTARLNLSTRRPSYVAWQTQIEDIVKISPLQEELDDEELTDNKENSIINALQWITEELTHMHRQDQDLARQLLTIRQDIQQIKLDMSCEFHQDMLAHVQLEMEEMNELSEICDQLPLIINNNPLRHLGVTRMNISTRRFSTC